MSESYLVVFKIVLISDILGKCCLATIPVNCIDVIYFFISKREGHFVKICDNNATLHLLTNVPSKSEPCPPSVLDGVSSGGKVAT